MRWLIKDFILLKKRLLIFFLTAVGYFLFMGGVFQGTGFESIAFIVASFILVYYFLISAFESDEKNGGMLLYLSMPYDREEIVFFRYLFGILLWLGLCIICSIVVFLIRPFMDISAAVGIGSFINGLFGVSIITSIYIPACYRFGYQKTKFVMMVGLIVTLVLSMQLINPSNETIYRILQGIFHQRPVQNLLVMASACLLLLLSYTISIKQYGVKDF